MLVGGPNSRNGAHTCFSLFPPRLLTFHSRTDYHLNETEVRLLLFCWTRRLAPQS